MKFQALLVVAAGLLVAADAKEDAVKKDKAGLKGTWLVVSLADGGENAPDEVVKKMRLVFQDDKMLVKGVDEEDHQASYTIDPSKKPATIDLVPTDGPEKGKSIRGIYQLEGDVLKICAASASSDDRPKEFASKQGDKITLIVLKREKK